MVREQKLRRTSEKGCHMRLLLSAWAFTEFDKIALKFFTFWRISSLKRVDLGEELNKHLAFVLIRYIVSCQCVYIAM